MIKSIFILLIAALLLSSSQNVAAQLPCCAGLKNALVQKNQQCSALAAEIASLKTQFKSEKKVLVPASGGNKPIIGSDQAAIDFNKTLRAKIVQKESELQQCQAAASAAQQQYNNCQSQGCGTLSVSPKGLSFLEIGGSQSVNVSADYPWSVSGGGGWATTQTNGNQLKVNCSANASSTARSTTLTINTTGGKSQTIGISQAAGATCSLSVAPTSVSLPAGGGEAKVTVTSTNPNWLAEKNLSWLSVQKLSDQLAITATANTASSARNGSISVTACSGKTVTISVSQGQAAPTCDANTPMQSVIDKKDRSANNLEPKLSFPSASHLEVVTKRDMNTGAILGISLKNGQSSFILTGGQPNDAKFSFALSPNKKALVMTYSSNSSSAATLLLFNVANGNQLISTLSITTTTGWQWGFANNDNCFIYKNQFSTAAKQLTY